MYNYGFICSTKYKPLYTDKIPIKGMKVIGQHKTMSNKLKQNNFNYFI